MKTYSPLTGTKCDFHKRLPSEGLNIKLTGHKKKKTCISFQNDLLTA